MRLILMAAICSAAAACSPNAPNGSSTPAASETTIATPEEPSHHWSEEKGGIYYYVTAVSDNDKANGQGAGDVVGYKFLGTNDDGEYTLGTTNLQGGTVMKAYCSKPCKIVRFSNGERMGYEEATVIGAAFADALSGQMKQTKAAAD